MCVTLIVYLCVRVCACVFVRVHVLGVLTVWRVIFMLIFECLNCSSVFVFSCSPLVFIILFACLCVCVCVNAFVCGYVCMWAFSCFRLSVGVCSMSVLLQAFVRVCAFL